ncbi:MAG: cytochrome c-type biogenesis CcmF C-terminal domain-containing protein, partial [Dehalococcoidales bacterium]|nr:cytochrome c-type biogenesis CcmF C-terminal domain-containing protein [Dehalococcoidales bacterium]
IFIAVGIIGSSFFNAEKETTLMPDESMNINGYTLTYTNLDIYQTESKVVVTASLSVDKEGKVLGILAPKKDFYPREEQSLTVVAMRSTLREDLYVILIGWEEDGTIALKVLVNPLVNW